MAPLILVLVPQDLVDARDQSHSLLVFFLLSLDLLDHFPVLVYSALPFASFHNYLYVVCVHMNVVDLLGGLSHVILFGVNRGFPGRL